MNFGILIRALFCILTLALLLYGYIRQQNNITQIRLDIPVAQKELNLIQEENVRLQFEIDQFESPEKLLELAQRPEYSHLKHPKVNEIITIPVDK